MDGLMERHETLRLEVDRLTEQLDEQRRLLAEVRQQIIEVERGT
jgi:chaperonin cofactor prefoldin